MGVKDNGGKPIAVRSCQSSNVLVTLLCKAVISLLVECIDVIVCFLYPQEMATELCRIK